MGPLGTAGPEGTGRWLAAPGMVRTPPPRHVLLPTQTCSSVRVSTQIMCPLSYWVIWPPLVCFTPSVGRFLGTLPFSKLKFSLYASNTSSFFFFSINSRFSVLIRTNFNIPMFMHRSVWGDTSMGNTRSYCETESTGNERS